MTTIAKPILDEVLCRALAAIAEGAFAVAKGIIETSPTDIQKSSSAKAMLSWCCAELGDVPTAEELAESLYHSELLTSSNLYWLGNAHLAIGQFEKAVSVFDSCLALDPTFSKAHNNRGVALEQLGRLQAASESYELAISRDSLLDNAYLNLVRLHERRGDFSAAVKIASRAQAQGMPDSLARLGTVPYRQSTPERAPASYVVSLFNQYASTFDQHLIGQLKYDVPNQLYSLVSSIWPKGNLDTLDLGCGTGLCGVQFRPLARQLTGVDLSPNMLEMARSRQVYDNLVEADIIDFLKLTSERSADLMIAADVFIYIGNLADVVREFARVSRPGGGLAFSIEARQTSDFELTENGRYAHSPDYIRNLAVSFGLRIATARDTILRWNSDLPVQGMNFVLQR